MKKIYAFLFAVLSGAALQAQHAVTLTVDMSNETVTSGVFVAGNFCNPDYAGDQENPAYASPNTGDGNWDPSFLAMTDMGSGLWSITMNLVDYRYEYKFINGGTWDGSESVPSTCTVEVSGNSNREIYVEGADTGYSTCFSHCAPCNQNAVRFRVDMSTQAAVNPLGVHVAGNFQAAAGLPGDWDPATAPLREKANGIWEATYVVGTASNIEFKYINGNDWIFPNENVENLPCGVAGGNRNEIVVAETVLPVYCFNACDPCVQPIMTTFQVDMSFSCADYVTEGLNLMGTVSDWGTGTAMSDTDGDHVYTVTLPLAPGNYEYKFRIGGGGWEGVSNRQLSVVAGPDVTLPLVCFNSADACVGTAWAPASVTFGCRPAGITMTVDQKVWVMGDFTNPSWQGGALEMSDADGDGVWYVTIPNFCPQSAFFKFAVGTDAEAHDTDASTGYEESADFSAIGGCGVDNGTFSDNRLLTRTSADAVSVCYTYDTCEDCTTGINELEVVNGLNVYPNPVSEILNISFNSAKAQNITFRVINNLGQVVSSQNIMNVSGQRNLTVDMSRFAAGLYTVELNNGTANQQVRVIVK